MAPRLERLLLAARALGLRRDDSYTEHVYEPIPGAPCAYRRVEGALRPLMYAEFENGNGVRAFEATAAKFLAALPALAPDKHLLSFEDGVLDIATMQFSETDEILADPAHPLSGRVARHHVAGGRWMPERDAPVFNRVLDCQFDWPDCEGVKDFLCAMLGRLFFEVGELDRWRAAPFLYGIGGSGKSLIVNFLTRCLFREGAAGHLASEREACFPLFGIVDCELVVNCALPERMSRSLGSEHTRVICSGGPVLITRKHLPPVEVPAWKAPAVFASNYPPPPWSLRERRLLPFHFGVRPPSLDGGLSDGLREEAPAILRQILAAYRALLEQVGPDADIFAAAPGAVREWAGLP